MPHRCGNPKATGGFLGGGVTWTRFSAQLRATGGVTFVTATEAAEAQSADYNLTNGTLVLRGEVLLTQGASALSADEMLVNLSSGTAQMTGRVRTVFQQDGN